MRIKHNILIIITLIYVMPGIPWLTPSQLSAITDTHARTLRCSICRKKIRTGKRYIKTKKQLFCSKKCYNSTLPTCSVCKRIIRKGFSKSKKLYCSKKCLSTTYPKCSGCSIRSSKMTLIGGPYGKLFCPSCTAKPRCYCCLYPFRNMKTLDDGRHLCDKCLKAAIFNLNEAKQLMKDIQQVMKTKLNLTTDHKIILRMVNTDSLQRRSPAHSKGREMGLFLHRKEYEKVTTRKYSLLKGESKKEKVRKINDKYFIYILSGLTKEKLTEVISHELGHDWMQANFPEIKDLQIKEGWAEYVAYLVNQEYGNTHLNRRIETNQDPIYGEGVRKFLKKSKRYGKNNYHSIIEAIVNND